MRNIIFLSPVFFLYILMIFMSLDTLSAKDNEAHILKWNKVEGASEYLVEVKNGDEIVFSAKTKENVIKLYLAEGTYLYQITVFDFFGKSVGKTSWVKLEIKNNQDSSTSSSNLKKKGKGGVTLLIEYLPTNIIGFPEPFFSGVTFGTVGLAVHWDFGQVLMSQIPILNKLGTEFMFTSSYITHYDEDPNKVLMTQYGISLYYKMLFSDEFHVVLGSGFVGSLINASSEISNGNGAMIFQGGVILSVDIQFIVSKLWVISGNCNILYSPGDQGVDTQINQIQFGLGTGIWM